MEKICGNYYLGANKNNYILYERKVSEEGGESYKKIGYYTSLDAIYATLINKDIKEDLGLLNNIKKISELINELKIFTVNFNKELSKH